MASRAGYTPPAAAAPSHHSRRTHGQAKRRGPFLIPPGTALALLLLARAVAAALAPIQDCDEVFNYWEPAHYLQHGHGFQTWEYSPAYSIRSWLYVGAHALLGKAAGAVLRPWSGGSSSSSKTAQFYAVRHALGLASALAEMRLYAALSRSVSAAVGAFFLAATVFAAGMFHASVALLPSSFAMVCAMLGASAFISAGTGTATSRSGVARGIMWFGIGAIVGWPFAGALVLPFVLETVLFAVMAASSATTTTTARSAPLLTAMTRTVKGGMLCLLVLALEVAVDSTFYRRLTVVPWNIVKYNVFGGAGRGPDIYGVEPWPFYLLNLALNFNGWFVLAMAAAPLLLAQGYLQSRAPTHATSKQAIVRLATLVSPFYMWLTIFTAQPHKEERFMYPAYPFLCLNAAISLQVLCTWIFTRTGRAQESATSRDSKASTELHDTAPPRRGLAVVACGLLAVTSLNILRSAGMVTAYSAPLKVLQPLQGERNAFESAESAASAEAGMADKHHTVCYGKEWYRFPSSYLLPDGMRAKFIRSEFDGLLPGEFVHRPGDLLHGTSVIPANMNDLNIGDPSKYIDIAHCDYLVDLSLQSQSTSPLEPDYANHAQHWEKVKCLPFMDAERTPTVARILWIPDLPVLPPQVRRAWGEYCLLRRRQSQ